MADEVIVISSQSSSDSELEGETANECVDLVVFTPTKRPPSPDVSSRY